MKANSVQEQIILNELERITGEYRALVLKQPELREPTVFVVWPDESDPHHCGPLRVEIGPDGARLWWLGDEKGDPESEFSWRDLRQFAELDRNVEKLEAMRDDLAREAEMYRRLAYRYRNAAGSMQRKFDALAATAPPETPMLAIER